MQKSDTQGLLLLEAQVTFGHDLMHGDREEEDGVTVIGSRASTEVLLHGLHDGEELIRQHSNVMEDDLQQMQKKNRAQQTSSHCKLDTQHTPGPTEAEADGASPGSTAGDGARGSNRELRKREITRSQKCGLTKEMESLCEGRHTGMHVRAVQWKRSGRTGNGNSLYSASCF